MADQVTTDQFVPRSWRGCASCWPVAGLAATLPTGSELLLHASSATLSAVTVTTGRSADRASLAVGSLWVWRGVVPACCATIGSSFLLVLVPGPMVAAGAGSARRLVVVFRG